MTTIGTLATNIYDNEFGWETGSARDTQISLVSGWLVGHLGELNTYIYTCFSGESPNNFGLEEQAIITEMYICEWYRKEQRNTLRGVATTSDGSATLDWEVLREGDTMIKKASGKDKAKNYQEAINASVKRFKDLVHSYNLYGARPSQVAGRDAPMYPTGATTSLDNYYK